MRVVFQTDSIEDHPNNVSSFSNTETSFKDPESYFDALVTINTCTIEESEIEGELEW